MSMLQTTTERSPSGNLRCPQCNTALPPRAMFCSSCGQRIGKEKKGAAPSKDEIDGSKRYRTTSLLRRRTYVSLYFAVDSHQQRMVAIRDIDISSLDDEARAKAAEFAQEEYDQLRRQPTLLVMPVIDLQVNQNHLLTIASQPIFGHDTDGENKTSIRLRTLQDFLQSGVGLPTQEMALHWVSGLCQAVEHLHAQGIVIGDLDPDAIVLSYDDYESQPTLMVSWLPLQIRALLPRTGEGEPASASTEATGFSAPEALLGKVEAVSDVYSLGAILYLLLTGATPDNAMQRMQHPLRSPRELNSRISSDIDAIIMRALFLEWSERFPSAQALGEALSNQRVSQPLKGQATVRGTDGNGKDVSWMDRIASVDTINITPLSQAELLRWEVTQSQMNSRRLSASTVEGTIQQITEVEDAPSAPGRSSESYSGTSGAGSGVIGAAPLPQRFRERITGIFPAIPRLPRQITGVLPVISRPHTEQAQAGSEESLLKQIQRAVLGEQQHTTTAAAIIETPLRVQPNQQYNIRIRLMGRDEASNPPGTKKGIVPRGLSAQAHGDLVYIEVRSTPHENFTYIVQQAAVNIPALGYVAEVIIPMQPFGSQANGRRERLHIVFMDEMHRSLYTRPFVIELFVSHLVQSGREGHHVLPIPV
jgi:serine/threonine protein kinase